MTAPLLEPNLMVSVREGDCLELMRAMPDESVDAVVSDPPYGLAFMGKQWDHGVPGVLFWAEALRVAKPGAHLVAFGGTRTYHRLTCAIEDAGWEIRDGLMWLYGSGFPKSLDVSKAIEKMRDDRADVLRVTAFVRAARDAKGITNGEIDAAFGMNGMAGHWTSAASQPSVPTPDQWERLRVVLGFGREMDDLVATLNARKGEFGEAFMAREVTGTVDPWVNGINYNITSRDGLRRDRPATEEGKAWAGWGTALKPAWEPIILARKPIPTSVAVNVLRHGTGALNVDGCRIGTEGGGTVCTNRDANGKCMGHKNAGRSTSGETFHGPDSDGGRWPANVILDEDAAAMVDAQSGERPGMKVTELRRGATTGRSIGFHGAAAQEPGVVGYGDTGGASRFYYCAKADRAERDAGLEGFPRRKVGTMEDDAYEWPDGRESAGRNHHPTVKPIDLMRWLVRLVTPPGGVVLDPFTGSGSTGCAAVLEGCRFVGCEKEPEYVPIIMARIDYWLREKTIAGTVTEAKPVKVDPAQPSLFD